MMGRTAFLWERARTWFPGGSQTPEVKELCWMSPELVYRVAFRFQSSAASTLSHQLWHVNNYNPSEWNILHFNVCSARHLVPSPAVLTTWKISLFFAIFSLLTRTRSSYHHICKITIWWWEFWLIGKANLF